MKIFLLLFGNLLSLLLLSQESTISVSPDRLCIAYIGVTNQIKIAVEGYKDEDLKITFDSWNSFSKITPLGNGKYDLIVTNGKEGKIIVVSKNDTIGRFIVTIKRIPDPKSNYSINGKIGSYDPIAVSRDLNLSGKYLFKKDELNSENFKLVAIPVDGFEYDYEFKITNYIFKHADTTKNINKTIECEGNRLNKKIKKYISKLPADSEISFTIICIGPDNEKRKLEPLVLKIM